MNSDGSCNDPDVVLISYHDRLISLNIKGTAMDFVKTKMYLKECRLYERNIVIQE